MRVEITPPDTATGNEAVENIRLRNVSGMSFAFVAKVDRWERDSNGKLLRKVIEAQLFEVSPVTFPSYESTSIHADRADSSARLFDAERERLLLDMEEVIT